MGELDGKREQTAARQGNVEMPVVGPAPKQHTDADTHALNAQRGDGIPDYRGAMREPCRSTPLAHRVHADIYLPMPFSLSCCIADPPAPFCILSCFIFLLVESFPIESFPIESLLIESCDIESFDIESLDIVPLAWANAEPPLTNSDAANAAIAMRFISTP